MNNRPDLSPERPLAFPPEKRPAARRVTTNAAVLLICLLAAFSVHAPYLDAFPTNDDIYLQLEIGYVATGRMPLWEFVRRDYNGQLFPLSKLLYYAAWRAFGLDPRPAHAFVLALHALGAMWLFHLLKGINLSTPAATAGAVLWASAAVGRWDNPLIWLCAGTIVMGLTWLVAALASTVAATRRASVPRGGTPYWPTLAATAASLASWSVMALLVPLVPLLRRLGLGSPHKPSTTPAPGVDTSAASENHSAGGLLRAWFWHSSWIMPLLVFGFWQAIVARQTALVGWESKEAPMTVFPRLAEALLRSTMLLGQSLAGLIVGAADWPPSFALGLGFALAVVVLVGTTKASSPARRTAWLLIVAAAFYLLVAAALRSDVARQELLAWGRYRYVPMLAWSAAVAVALDPLVGRSGMWRRRGPLLVLAILLAASAIRQHRIADATAADFVRLRGPLHDVYTAQQRLLAHLISTAQVRQRPLRFPQIPLDLPPVRGVQFPLSNFVALHHPGGTPHLQVVMAESLRNADVQDALAVLQASGNPRAAQWAAMLREVVKLQRLIRWLDRFASQSGETIVFPHNWKVTFAVPFSSGSWRVPLSQIIADGFEKPPQAIAFAEASHDRTRRLQKIAARLRESHAVEARIWLTMLAGENSAQ